MNNEGEKIKYRKFPAVFQKRTDKAVLVEIGAKLDRVWIPRVALSMVSDLEVESLYPNDEFSLELADWKAEDLKL